MNPDKPLVVTWTPLGFADLDRSVQLSWLKENLSGLNDITGDNSIMRSLYFSIWKGSHRKFQNRYQLSKSIFPKWRKGTIGSQKCRLAVADYVSKAIKITHTTTPTTTQKVKKRRYTSTEAISHIVDVASQCDEIFFVDGDSSFRAFRSFGLAALKSVSKNFPFHVVFVIRKSSQHLIYDTLLSLECCTIVETKTMCKDAADTVLSGMVYGLNYHHQFKKSKAIFTMVSNDRFTLELSDNVKDMRSVGVWLPPKESIAPKGDTITSTPKISNNPNPTLPRCDICKNEGHIGNVCNCLYRDFARKFSNSKCKECKQIGHTKRSCLKITAANQRKASPLRADFLSSLLVSPRYKDKLNSYLTSTLKAKTILSHVYNDSTFIELVRLHFNKSPIYGVVSGYIAPVSRVCELDSIRFLFETVFYHCRNRIMKTLSCDAKRLRLWFFDGVARWEKIGNSS